MAKLSVVINAQNVERDLPKAIASIKKLADEIVVIDQGSIDKTREVAIKLGAKVYDHESVSYVELARNFAISKSSHEWVLILDPDEEIPTKLSKKIKQIIEKNSFDYLRIPRKNIIFGSWIEHTNWWPDYQTRLFKKGKVSWSEIIHSVPLTTGRGSDLPSREEYAILHHNYNSVESYIEKLNRYTSVQAGILAANGYKFYWMDLIDKPLKEFVNRYFQSEGYKDKLHGLALSLLQGFSELVVYLKVWQNEKFTEKDISTQKIIDELRSKEKDLHFWESDVLFKQYGRIQDRIKRKLRI